MLKYYNQEISPEDDKRNALRPTDDSNQAQHNEPTTLKYYNQEVIPENNQGDPLRPSEDSSQIEINEPIMLEYYNQEISPEDNPRNMHQDRDIQHSDR